MLPSPPPQQPQQKREVLDPTIGSTIKRLKPPRLSLFEQNQENTNPNIPLVVNIDADVSKENYTIEDLINKTFTDNPDMSKIASELLQKVSQPELKVSQPELTEKNVSGMSRQPGVQEILFKLIDGSIEKINVSVPKSKIYDMKNHPDLLVKKMTISKNNRFSTPNESKFLIIREITFQMYAHQFFKKCHIYVPQIISTRFYEDNDDFVCEVVMEKIVPISRDELMRLSDDEKIELFSRTKTALDCLRSNSIFHNDTHANNVLFIKETNGTIAPCLIDFGKANTEKSQPSTTGINVSGTNVSGTNVLEEFNSWIYPESFEKLSKEQINDRRFDEKYGGLIKRKTNKRNYKNKKGTRRSNTKKRIRGRKTRRG